MNRISLNNFKILVSKIDVNGFNLLLGAGISKDPPTCGPIWTEMQVGFLNAVFDRMEDERWPVSTVFPAHRKRIKKLNIRPELFWRQMLTLTSKEVIWKALEAAGVGPCNENHIIIAALLKSGFCKWAITTNFDEYIEKNFNGSQKVAIVTSDTKVSDVVTSNYIKLHGSLSVGQSLSYTLEHYDDLVRRNAVYLEATIPKRPLIIAGYSGYDTDILPILKDLAKKVPWIIVLHYPGSHYDQPILKLATKGSRIFVLESTCPDALSILSKNINLFLPSISAESLKKDGLMCYSDAVEKLEMHLCPEILLVTFSLTGSWDLVQNYAWLTHDAVQDSRYFCSISKKEYRIIHEKLAMWMKIAGDNNGAKIMMNEARSTLSESVNNISNFLNHIQVEAIIKNTPSQSAMKATNITVQHDKRPSDTIAALYDFNRRGRNSTKREIFNTNWQIGINRRREGNPSGAIKAFNKASEVVMDAVITHLERGRFLLDFGVAVFQHAVELSDSELAEQAYLIFIGCIEQTESSEDWGTNARANMMIARIVAIVDNFTEASKHLDLARLAASKTDDKSLAVRIKELESHIKELVN